MQYAPTFMIWLHVNSSPYIQFSIPTNFPWINFKKVLIVSAKLIFTDTPTITFKGCIYEYMDNNISSYRIPLNDDVHEIIRKLRYGNSTRISFRGRIAPRKVLEI